MIDCVKCPRAHLFRDNRGNIYKIFCPFLGMQECIYGEHCIAGQAVVQRPVIRSSRMIQIYIPEFLPYIGRKKPKTDWKSLHQIIFTLWSGGKSKKEIAERVGVSEDSLVSYMRRY